jgi:hypothetical protein
MLLRIFIPLHNKIYSMNMFIVIEMVTEYPFAQFIDLSALGLIKFTFASIKFDVISLPIDNTYRKSQLIMRVT